MWTAVQFGWGEWLYLEWGMLRKLNLLFLNRFYKRKCENHGNVFGYAEQQFTEACETTIYSLCQRIVQVTVMVTWTTLCAANAAWYAVVASWKEPYLLASPPDIPAIFGVTWWLKNRVWLQTCKGDLGVLTLHCRHQGYGQRLQHTIELLQEQMDGK